MTLRSWLQTAERRLAAAGIESAKLEAQLLAAHARTADRSWVLAHANEEFDASSADALLARREKREPLAYILGYREFYGRRFTVTPDVLIPRQETETLIETALALPIADQARVLDVGVGSGAIAITLKLERPSWQVTAVDISPAALAVAAENARELGADIRLIESDIFSAIPDETFDLIVTNPPYIGVGEPLMPEVANFEPSLALFAGESGLDFYRRLTEESAVHLDADGYLAMEIGHLQSIAVSSLFAVQGWAQAQTVVDLSGIDRVLAFCTRNARARRQ